MSQQSPLKTKVILIKLHLSPKKLSAWFLPRTENWANMSANIAIMSANKVTTSASRVTVKLLTWLLRLPKSVLTLRSKQKLRRSICLKYQPNLLQLLELASCHSQRLRKQMKSFSWWTATTKSLLGKKGRPLNVSLPLDSMCMRETLRGATRSKSKKLMLNFSGQRHLKVALETVKTAANVWWRKWRY